MSEQTITRLSVYEDSDQLIGDGEVVRVDTFWCVDYTVSVNESDSSDHYYYCAKFVDEAAAMAHVEQLKAQFHVPDEVLTGLKSGGAGQAPVSVWTRLIESGQGADGRLID